MMPLLGCPPPPLYNIFVLPPTSFPYTLCNPLPSDPLRSLPKFVLSALSSPKSAPISPQPAVKKFAFVASLTKPCIRAIPVRPLSSASLCRVSPSSRSSIQPPDCCINRANPITLLLPSELGCRSAAATWSRAVSAARRSAAAFSPLPNFRVREGLDVGARRVCNAVR